LKKIILKQINTRWKNYHRWFILISIILVILNYLNCVSDDEMRIVETGEGYQFYENDLPVLFYRVKPLTTPDGTHSRANYCHPVYDLDGEIITRDFPEDHLHHRGIFWAWHQVYIGDQLIRDMWDCTDFIWDIHHVNVEDGDNSAALVTQVFWKSSQWNEGMDPFAEETVSIRIYKTEKDMRIIDYEIRIKALVDELRIGGSDDVKGYGGFSTRIPLPDDLEMTDKNGPVTPDNLAVPAGDWMNFSGTFNSKKSSITVMINPSNPGKSRNWILRKKGSCQNVAFPGREPISVSMEKPLVLKYRVVIHKGADLDVVFSEYSRK